MTQLHLPTKRPVFRATNLAMVAACLGLMQPREAGAAWETVLEGSDFSSYAALEPHWDYLYPWGSDHNGSARMYAQSWDRDNLWLSADSAVGVLTLRANPISWDEGNSI